MNLLTSLFWTLWHFPAIFYGGYAVSQPTWLGVVLFCINLILASFILGWLRQKTGGVIAPTLVHTANNIGMVMTGVSGIILGETGLLLTLLLLIFLLYTKAWKSQGLLFEIEILKEKYLG